MCFHAESTTNTYIRRHRAVPSNDDAAQTFKEFDYDGDGHITAVEFKLAMTARREAVTGDEIDSIFLHADQDKDGRINLVEFTEAWNA
jgi:Ca2+-binding EF-hand superfamily protein